MPGIMRPTSSGSRARGDRARSRCARPYQPCTIVRSGSVSVPFLRSCAPRSSTECGTGSISRLGGELPEVLLQDASGDDRRGGVMALAVRFTRHVEEVVEHLGVDQLLDAPRVPGFEVIAERTEDARVLYEAVTLLSGVMYRSIV